LRRRHGPDRVRATVFGEDLPARQDGCCVSGKSIACAQN
jgi:hypothetical protein